MVFLFFLGYVVSFGYFTNYLRRFHRGTYVDLGEPRDPTSSDSLQEIMKLLGALFYLWGFIFSGAHEQLADPRLSLFVWWMRLIISGCLILFVGLFFFQK
jgi:hypothetical protein